MMEDNTIKSIYNMDEDRLKSLNYYMKVCEIAMVNWDLENIYVFLNAMRRMIIGAHKKPVEEKLTKGFEEFETLKRQLDLSKSEEEYHKNRSEFYNKADRIYSFINKLNIAIGMYFRKGDDTNEAELKD